MGTTSLDASEVADGARIYAHSRKDSKEGVAYLIVNNTNETITLELPKEADVYMLAGETGLRARNMTLNGNVLVLEEGDELPVLDPVKAEGTIEIPTTNCAFVVL